MDGQQCVDDCARFAEGGWLYRHVVTADKEFWLVSARLIRLLCAVEGEGFFYEEFVLFWGCQYFLVQLICLVLIKLTFAR